MGLNYFAPLTNCYNSGKISGGNYVGGVVGYNYDASVTNCYYLTDTANGGIEGADAAGQAEAKTAAQFKSGEVAYLLGEAFGQTIGTDAYPVLGGVKVYAGYNACEDEEKSYSNSEFTKTIPGHEWSYSDDVDGKHSITCKFCDETETEAHTLIYSASGTTITAACSANCGHRATAVISAENVTYDGCEQKTATVTYSDNWAGITFEPTYENNIKVGTATATIAVDEAAASASFTIGKKELTLKLTDCYKEYDGTNVLTNFHAEVEGFIFYDEGEYVSSVLDYDDVYDDVSVDATKLVVTLPHSDVGNYTTAKVSGITLIGKDAANYTIAAEIDEVLLENDYHNFEISPMSVYITILDQVIGEGQDIDPNAYYLDKEMPEGHTLTGIQLLVNEEAKEIYVEKDENDNIVGLKVTNAKGEDVTHCFDFSVYVTGWLTRTHEGHTFNEDGFCATGRCNEYMPAVARANELDKTVYEISNAGQLYWFAQQMEMNSWYEGYAELTKDITIPATAPNWEPINASYAYFKGNYHTISGLKCIGTDYVGMFGNVWYCEVSNLHITNSYFEGGNNAGAVIGDMSNGGIVINCYVTDTTVEGSGNVGGLMGYNGGSVTNCYTTASALVGHSSGSIENSYYLSETETEDGGKTEAQFKSGEVAWLLQSGVTIYDEDLGDYTTEGAPHIWGQTIGTENYPVFGGTKVYKVVNCKNDFVKYSNTDEIIGHDWANGDGKCTVCGTPCDHEFVDSICTVCGFECKDHGHIGTYINGCCIICGAPCEHESYTDGKCDDCGDACKHESYTKGFCTVCDDYEPAALVDGYYQISNAGQLYWFAKQFNEEQTTINGKLTADIVVNENVLKADGSPNNGEFRSWTPIGNDGNRYQGTFDGNGKTVSGLYFNSSGTDHVGLFGFVSNGTIKNVGIVDSYFGGTSFIGGVVGFNRGTVTDCYNSGTVSGKGHSVGGVVGNTIGTVTNCYNSGTVSGEGHSVGGVVGYNNSGTVTKCYNTGTVSGNSKCNYVGGVAGYNSRGFVTNCHNSGTVSGNDSVGGVVGDNKGTVKNSYNIGTVSGNNSVGGVVGYNKTGTVTNCYYLIGIANGGIDGANAAGQAEAKTAAQFKSGEVAYLLGDAFGQTIGTEDYPVLGGAKVYRVKNCKDETTYSNTDGDNVHNWENGVCTVCGTAAPFAFYGSNVTLGNALDLNFAVEKALLPDGAYGMINGTKVKWTYQKQPDGTELMLLTYSGLAAKEMGTVVTATVYDKDGKLLGTREDSIMSYAMRSLENPNFPKNAKPLLIKMLDYGAAAQVEFAYNTNSLVNAGITEAMRTAYPTTARTSDILSPAIGDLYMGTSLILENAIEMQMGFKGTPEGITATVSYTDHYGKAQTYENADLQPYKDKNTGEVVAYGVVIPGIVVADGRQAVTVTVYKNGTELIKVTDSIASYVARNNSRGVYGAIMGFSDAAHAYLHTKGA